VGGRAVSLLLLIAIGACNSVSPFAGNWEGKRSLDFVPNTDPSIQYTASRVQLTVSPDGRFTLVDRSLPLEGQIEPDGTLRIEQMNGRPAEVKAPAKLSRQGDSLRLVFEGSIELRQMSPK
jgi:hypothetical protein